MSTDINLDHLHETIHAFCELDWYVFPLAPRKKTPITPNGFKDATNDASLALRWFDRGDLNIGIATGPSKLVVVDGDGEAGNIWLHEANELYGIPPTLTVRTRSGGFHYYFEAPACTEIKCSASKVAKGVDIRATGGYVVGPSSWVEADKKGCAGWYKVIDDSPVAPLPDWLLTLIIVSELRSTSTAQPQSIRKTSTKPETPRNVAALQELLTFVNADCPYETYRAVIWSILSTGWNCAENIALKWSQSAPDRFEQSCFDALVNTYDPTRSDAISYGTLVYLARQGGYRG